MDQHVRYGGISEKCQFLVFGLAFLVSFAGGRRKIIGAEYWDEGSLLQEVPLLSAKLVEPGKEITEYGGGASRGGW